MFELNGIDFCIGRFNLKVIKKGGSDEPPFHVTP